MGRLLLRFCRLIPFLSALSVFWVCPLWHLADISNVAANVRFRGKADIIQEKVGIKKCPLVTQSGHAAHPLT
jgi:hypothetical protein